MRVVSENRLKIDKMEQQLDAEVESDAKDGSPEALQALIAQY